MSDVTWCEKLNSGDSWDFRYQEKLVCPHCGNSSDPSEFESGDLYDEGLHEVSCGECGFDFDVSTFVTHRFSTHKQETE